MEDGDDAGDFGVGGGDAVRVLSLFLLTAVLWGQTQRVQFDLAATKVNWTLGDVLHTVHGTFKVKSADLWFDPATGKAGGKIVVDAASGDSGSKARDSRMNKNVLESDKYPELLLVPESVEGKVSLAGESQAKLHGAFTIHGATHEIVMQVKSHIEGGKFSATISFPVPYQEWGMKNPSTLFLKVNDTVAIDIQAAGEIKPGT